MTKRKERLRWAAALAGPLMFFASSFMPLFGGGAKNRARCAGREFTGEWGDCLTDYIPILEILVPALALCLVWMFTRFAFTLWAPHPETRIMNWRIASSTMAADHWPILQIFAAAGAVWAAWRGTTYLFASELWPFTSFWLLFAAWFVGGFVVALPRRASDEPGT